MRKRILSQWLKWWMFSSQTTFFLFWLDAISGDVWTPSVVIKGLVHPPPTRAHQSHSCWTTMVTGSQNQVAFQKWCQEHLSGMWHRVKWELFPHPSSSIVVCCLSFLYILFPFDHVSVSHSIPSLILLGDLQSSDVFLMLSLLLFACFLFVSRSRHSTWCDSLAYRLKMMGSLPKKLTRTNSHHKKPAWFFYYFYSLSFHPWDLRHRGPTGVRAYPKSLTSFIKNVQNLKIKVELVCHYGEKIEQKQLFHVHLMLVKTHRWPFT